MFYKIIKKVFYLMYKNYTLKKLLFFKKNCKKSISLGENVKINNKNVTVGDKVSIYDNVIIWGDGPVVLDDGCKIGYNTIIYASQNAGVYIGKNTAIAANSYIIDMNHNTGILNSNLNNENNDCEKIEIGNNVWIGAQCVLAKGTILADKVIVGANSFVNNSFPENSIIAGSPAKIIKYRGQ